MENGVLRRKRPVEGWLLGMGGLMPAGLLHGQGLDLPLVINFSDHRECTETLPIWTERLEKPPRAIARSSTAYERVAPQARNPSVRVGPIRPTRPSTAQPEEGIGPSRG